MEQEMTLYDVAMKYAKAWNTLDPYEFIEVLADDVVYDSQYVLESLHGKETFRQYIQSKMSAVANSNAIVKCDVGETTQSVDKTPCALLFQSNTTTPDAIILFKITEEKVSKIDLCIPALYAPQALNVFPK